MRQYHLIIYQQSKQTRLLLYRAQNQLLKAILPHPYESKACEQLTRALSNWVNQRLHVVVSVAEWENLSAFELHDGFGAGIQTETYYSDIDIRSHRRRSQQIKGFGSFRALIRQIGRWA